MDFEEAENKIEDKNEKQMSSKCLELISNWRKLCVTKKEYKENYSDALSKLGVEHKNDVDECFIYILLLFFLFLIFLLIFLSILLMIIILYLKLLTD